MAETEKAKEKPTLMPGQRQLAEQVRTVHVAIAEPGVTFKQMLDPDYWAHEARYLMPYDMVECRSKDGTFWGLAIVLVTGRNWAKLKELQYHPLDTKDVSQTQVAQDSKEGFSIEYKGAKLLHVVIRKSDGAILHEGERLKKDAEAWLENHLTVTT